MYFCILVLPFLEPVQINITILKLQGIKDKTFFLFTFFYVAFTLAEVLFYCDLAEEIQRSVKLSLH